MDKALTAGSIADHWLGAASYADGEMGIVSDLCIPVGAICNMLNLPHVICYVLIVISLATSIPESVKLSGAFGKGRILGVLMAFPVFKEISRFIFGNSAKSK